MAKKVRPKSEHHDIAKALGAAFDPLIDVCLEIGITSPELEVLLRATFVQRAYAKLPRHSTTGRAPSANKVSMAVGLHRTEVGKIHSEGGTDRATVTMENKERLYSKSARVLAGWVADARFTTSGGAPLDLPMERNKQSKSFEDLVDKYAPGNFPGTVLKELRRRGNVELLEDDIIRFKSATAQTGGATPRNVTLAAKRMKRLGETLFQNILDQKASRLYAETKTIGLSAKQIGLLRPVLERRVDIFIASLEAEFRTRSETGLNGDMKKMGVSVFSWDEESN